MASHNEVLNEDSRMDAGDSNTNFGSSGTLIVQYSIPEGKAEFIHAIARIDFSDAPGLTSADQVTLAAVHGYITSIINEGVVGVTWVRCVAETYPWTEDGVTWMKYDGVNNWGTAGGNTDGAVTGDEEFPTLTGWYAFDVLNNVRDAVTNRSSIFDAVQKPTTYDTQTSNNVIYCSKDYADSRFRPWLGIEYTVAGGALIKYISGVAWANVKEVSGVAEASINKVSEVSAN